MDVTPAIVRDALSRHSKKALADPSLTPAGVLLVLYLRDGKLHLLLNKRSQEVEDHKGEIAFPGGRRDAGDATILSTALREAQEEMGIAPQDVDVLGELDDVPTISSYLITPFVGAISGPYEFKPNRQEVAEVLEAPLSAFMDEKNIRDEMRLLDGKPVNRRAYAYDGHLVYGATAIVLSTFLDLLNGSSSGADLQR